MAGNPPGHPAGYPHQQFSHTNTYAVYMPSGAQASGENYANAAIQAAMQAMGGGAGTQEQPAQAPPTLPTTTTQFPGYGGYLETTADGRPSMAQMAQHVPEYGYQYPQQYQQPEAQQNEPDISPLWNPAWGDPFTDAQTYAAYQQWLQLQESGQQVEGSYYADGGGTGEPAQVEEVAAHQVGYDPRTGMMVPSQSTIGTSSNFLPAGTSQLIRDSLPSTQAQAEKVQTSGEDPKKVYHEGWLYKQGGSRARGFFSSRNWKRRYFMLKDRQLRYYKSHDAARQDKNPLRTVLVDEMRVQRADHIIDRKRTIELYHTGMSNPFYVQAETRKAQEEWRIALIKAAAKPGQTPDAQPRTEGKSLLPAGMEIPKGARVVIRRQTRFHSDSSSSSD